MLHDNYFEYYENFAHWTFDEYDCHEECLTDWDLYKILRTLAAPDSHILDLGTAGGEKILAEFPCCAEILGTDYSPKMIDTARANLAASGRTDVSFKVMDNLKTKKCFQIITSDPRPIEDYITGTLHRGATRLHGEGVYSHEGKEVLMTVVSRHEAVLLRNFIRRSDPSAFLIITSSTEIIGKGFRGVN